MSMHTRCSTSFVVADNGWYLLVMQWIWELFVCIQIPYNACYKRNTNETRELIGAIKESLGKFSEKWHLHSEIILLHMETLHKNAQTPCT